MVTVRLARDSHRRSKLKQRSSVGKKPVARAIKATFVMSEAERYLRRQLALSKKIKSPTDDKGLYDWLENLRLGGDDSRSQWEKNLQARLAREMGIWQK